MITRLCSLCVFLALALVLSGCEKSSSASRVEKKGVAAASTPVTVTPVRTQRVQRTVEIVGTLFANEEVTVSSELDGRIAAIHADLGDGVRQGDTLAKIEDAEFRFAVQQIEASLKETLAKLGLERVPPANFDVAKTSLALKAQAELTDAQVNLKRMKALLEEKVISHQEYDTADTRYKTALAVYNGALEEARALIAQAHSKEAQLGTARKRLEDTTIRTAMSGSVSKRMVSAGEYVKIGAALFTLVQEHPLKLRGMVPERFAPEIRVGQAVDVRVDSFPNQVFKGKLSRLAPASEVQSRSFTIEALIENPRRILKPGFFAKAAIFTKVDSNALTVPQQALVTFAGVSKVFVVQDNQFARERIVQTGVRTGDNEVEIVSGLKPGELVVISGLTRLIDGSPVQVSGPSLPIRKSGERQGEKS
ncbi:MAG: efflux RND transporter periplasmic adaptor subunit [Deltaproteobacteria bacterium]|nr:efflux RND transporter periplasmic adaptor subunit [Deltaproteobacteria bacterium]